MTTLTHQIHLAPAPYRLACQALGTYWSTGMAWWHCTPVTYLLRSMVYGVGDVPRLAETDHVVGQVACLQRRRGVETRTPVDERRPPVVPWHADQQIGRPISIEVRDLRRPERRETGRPRRSAQVGGPRQIGSVEHRQVLPVPWAVAGDDVGEAVPIEVAESERVAEPGRVR